MLNFLVFFPLVVVLDVSITSSKRDKIVSLFNIGKKKKRLVSNLVPLNNADIS